MAKITRTPLYTYFIIAKTYFNQIVVRTYSFNASNI